jgi:hypothetical protein
MPQARRIKPKPKAKSKKAKKTRRNIPWGLLLVILVSLAALAALFNGTQSDDSRIGAGLRAIFESNNHVSDAEDKAIEDLINNKSTEKEFDFYTILPDIEQIMPDDLPGAAAPKSSDIDYFLQAASFKSHADAEKLRARLALKGFKSITQIRSSEEKGTLYRVRLGPYANKRESKNAKVRLQKLGIRPFLFTVKKDT